MKHGWNSSQRKSLTYSTSATGFASLTLAQASVTKRAMKRIVRRLSLVVLASLCATTVLMAAEDFKVSEFSFQRPAAWEWVPVNSPMRKAQIKINDPKSKDACDVVFYHFGPGGAGGTQANVDRWFGQFEEAKDKINAQQSEKTVGKTKVVYVQAEGTYKSGMPGGPTTPMPNYALIGAILEGGDGSVFVRLTGPKALAKVSLDEFKKMIESGLK